MVEASNKIPRSEDLAKKAKVALKVAADCLGQARSLEELRLKGLKGDPALRDLYQSRVSLYRSLGSEIQEILDRLYLL